MRRIDPSTGKLSTEDTTLYALASRPRTPDVRGSIEAPFIVRRNGYWYLFASFDFCCRGAKSTYNVAVGRAKQITGPYLDRENKPMADGGGTLVVPANTEQWHGAGHEAVFRDGGRDYLLFHAYDAVTGRPRLEISDIQWVDGWPRMSP
jgi:arabinan endo-1,5-alpha-L-arabinosidase